MKLKIDWQNHLIGFIATIIGIIIGLNLDELQKNNDTQKRLDDFRKLIRNEINTNISQLDTFLINSNKHELQLKFLINKNIDNNNILICTKEEIDSVNNVWFPNPFIINIEKLSKNKFKVYFALSMFDYSFQNTVWESFKNTDLINHLDANEITKLTKLYKDFQEYEQYINTKNTKLQFLIDNRNTDKSLSILRLNNYLTQLTDLMYEINLHIDQELNIVRKRMGYVHITKYPEVNMKSIIKSKKTIN